MTASADAVVIGSGRKVGQFTAFNGVQGRRSGSVHLAGEHTSVDFQGFIEGALRSGYRCAREITGR